MARLMWFAVHDQLVQLNFCCLVYSLFINTKLETLYWTWCEWVGKS